MKRLLYLFCLTLLSFLTSYGQDQSIAFKKDEVSGDNYYEEIVMVPGVSQADLYKRAKSWILSNMKTGDNNISFDEKEYTIVNSAALKVDPKKWLSFYINDGIIDFKFHVWLKEGKCKFRMDNITYHLNVTSRSGVTSKSETYNELGDDKRDEYLKEQAFEKMTPLVSVFKKAMATEAAQDKKDW